MEELALETLRGLLKYDPDTGFFYWLVSSSNRAAVGAIAGSQKSHGYWVIGVSGGVYRAHRLAWFYMTGTWPSADVDHINGIRHDNRWANLRSASRTQNLRNARLRIDNVSGLKGVSWNSRRKKWSAYIKISGRSKQIGLFETAEEAHQAYCRAADLEFGEFSNHGVVT